MQQRQIKFRAWDRTRAIIIPVPRLVFGDDGAALTVIVEAKNSNGYHWPLVVGETCELMQATGLLDKNGKEIYEGDWIACKHRDTNVRAAVTFSSAKGMFGLSLFGVAPFTDFTDLEVIGNIHENPDLIESGTNQQEV